MGGVGGVKASRGRPRPTVPAAFPAGLEWARRTQASDHKACQTADSPQTCARRRETLPCLCVCVRAMGAGACRISRESCAWPGVFTLCLVLAACHRTVASGPWCGLQVVGLRGLRGY